MTRTPPCVHMQNHTFLCPKALDSDDDWINRSVVMKGRRVFYKGQKDLVRGRPKFGNIMIDSE